MENSADPDQLASYKGSEKPENLCSRAGAFPACIHVVWI